MLPSPSLLVRAARRAACSAASLPSERGACGLPGRAGLDRCGSAAREAVLISDAPSFRCEWGRPGLVGRGNAIGPRLAALSRSSAPLAGVVPLRRRWL